jgi:hypothetical protein
MASRMSPRPMNPSPTAGKPHKVLIQARAGLAGNHRRAHELGDCCSPETRLQNAWLRSLNRYGHLVARMLAGYARCSTRYGPACWERESAAEGVVMGRRTGIP